MAKTTAPDITALIAAARQAESVLIAAATLIDMGTPIKSEALKQAWDDLVIALRPWPREIVLVVDHAPDKDHASMQPDPLQTALEYAKKVRAYHADRYASGEPGTIIDERMAAAINPIIAHIEAAIGETLEPSKGPCNVR